MNSFLSRYATPLTTGLFLVSLVSGAALFLHVGESAFHGMHEWLSMVLILPFVLHVWKNWRAFLTYFKRPPMAIALGLSTAAAIVFAWPTITGSQATAGGPPQLAVLEAVAAAPLATMAPIFGHDGESLSKALGEAGYKIENADQTFAEIAAATGKTTREIMGTLGRLKQ